MVSPSRSSSPSRWALQTSPQQSWQHARRPSLPDTSDKIAVAKRSLSSQHVRSASCCRRRRSAPDQGRCRRCRRRGAGSVLGGRLYRICQMQVSVAEGNPSLQHVRSASRLRRRRSAPDRELNVDGVTVTRFERAVKKDFPQQLKLASDISDRDGLRAHCRRRCVDVCDTCLDWELNVDGDTMTRLERAVKMDFSQQQESYPTISGRDGLRARYQGRRIDICDTYASTRGSPCEI